MTGTTTLSHPSTAPRTVAHAELQVRPVGGRIGAEIRGVALGAELDDATIGAINAALLEHKVLFFRGQSHLDDAAQEAFAARFGETVAHPTVNSVASGSRLLELDSKHGTRANSWHTDVTFVDAYPKISILRGVVIPPAGGDTWLCGMIAACASLPSALRTAVAGRSIKHDGTYNSGGYLRAGLKDSSDPKNSVGTPHPIICVHPPSGRHTLYLGRRRNAYIVDMPLAESEALLDELWAHAARPEFAFAHRWRIGDVLMWDNRTTMHRRDPFDAASRRIMHRTQMKGQSRPGLL